MEKRVQDRKQELYRAQTEERRETVASTQSPNTETRRSVDRGEEHSIALESRRREERAEMDRSVTVSQRSNGLHSTPAPEHQPYSEPQDDRQTRRTPSFRLNAGKCIHFYSHIFSTVHIDIMLKKKRKKKGCEHEKDSYLLFFLCRWSYTLTSV